MENYIIIIYPNMTNNMKGMLVTLGLFLGLSASRLIVYGPQTLKDKFAYNGNTPSFD